MKTKVLNYEQAHQFVEENRTAFWDNYTMVLFTPTKAGATHKRGMRRDGQWGVATRIDVSGDGNWRVR